jgi:leader peptidase (prepilin peptidase)/N-methyltransferase
VELVYLIFAVLLGLALGSFLNVCIVRLPRGESIATPGSHCMHCQVPIRPYDNLPIVSWLWLHGRCRYCGHSISIRYPLVEAASAILFAACLLLFGLDCRGLGMAIFCWMLLGLALTDAETFLLPNAFTLPGIFLGVFFSGLSTSEIWPGLLQALIGLTAIGGVLLIIRTVYQVIRRREGMGFGDVKLGAMLGAWLGWRLGAIALFLAILSGAAGGVLVVLLKTKSGNFRRNESAGLQIPFGTFLAAAGIITVFAGDALLRWYVSLFR